MRATIGLALVLAVALAGSEGFSSLRIAPGVREAGMGGVGVASAEGPQAMVWNPAATAVVTGFGATAGYTKWFLDTHQQSVFLCRNLRRLVVGGGISSFSAGRFEYRELTPTEEPLGYFEPVELSVYLNFAGSLGAIGELGATARYFYSKVLSYQAAGLGVDLGARLRPARNLTLGASIVDFGQTVAFRRDPAWLPTRARLGASYDVPFGDVTVTLAGDAFYYFYSRGYGAQAGAEVQVGQLVQFRAGYDVLATANHLNFGMGLRPGRFRMDYAFAPLRHDLGSAHRFSVGLGL